MKQCLVCQTSEDQASLHRLPVSLEGQPLADFLVCAGCIELLGSEQVASLVRAAALEGAYQPSQIIPAPGSELERQSNAGQRAQSTSNASPEAPRTLDLALPAGALANEATFGAWLGEKVAPLLLGQYRQGRGQVTLLTSLTQGETEYRFRVLLGD
jgi:hypothetical protein